jgi:hypothetical protein
MFEVADVIVEIQHDVTTDFCKHVVRASDRYLDKKSMPSLPILLFDFARGQVIRIGSVSDRMSSRMIQTASGSSCFRSCIVLGSDDPPLAELLRSKRSYIGARGMQEWKEDD